MERRSCWIGAVILFVNACGGAADKATAPSQDLTPVSIAISVASEVMVPGETQSVLATAKTSSGFTLSTNYAAVWTSSDTTVLKYLNGTLSATKVGSATLTASASGLISSKLITVKPDSVVSVTIPSSLVQGGGVSAIVLGKIGKPFVGAFTFASSNPAVATVGTDGFIVGKEPGSTTITLNDGNKTYSQALTIQPVPVVIRLFIVDPLPRALRDSLYSAVMRWESVFTKPLPLTEPINPVTLANNTCITSTGVVPKANDGIYVVVFVGALTSPNPATEAQAGVCFSRPDNNAQMALVRFNQAVVAQISEARGKTVSLHEIGHVLGIGGINQISFRSGVPGPDPRFMGAEATRQYNAITNRTNNGVPLENLDTGGIYTHWRSSSLPGEVMSFNGGASLISKISLGALMDFGFSVDLSKADPYPAVGQTLPIMSPFAPIQSID